LLDSGGKNQAVFEDELQKVKTISCL